MRSLDIVLCEHSVGRVCGKNDRDDFSLKEIREKTLLSTTTHTQQQNHFIKV